MKQQQQPIAQEERPGESTGFETLSAPPVIAKGIQARIILRAAEAVGHAVWEAMPPELRKFAPHLEPYLAIPKRESLHADPDIALNFWKQLEHNVVWAAVPGPAKADIETFKRAASAIVHLSAVCMEMLGRGEDDSRLRAKLVALDQEATTVALMTASLGAAARSIPRPRIMDHFLAAPPVAPTEAALSADELAKMVALAEAAKRGTDPVPEGREIKRSLGDRFPRLRQFFGYIEPFLAKIPDWAGKVGLTVAVAAIGYVTVATGNTLFAVGLIAAIGLCAFFGANRTRTAQARESGGENSLDFWDRDIFRLGGFRGGVFGNSWGRGQGQGKERKLGEHSRSKYTSIIGNGKHGGPSSFGRSGLKKEKDDTTGHFETQDPQFLNLMPVCEPYVVTGRDGRMITVTQWLEDMKDDSARERIHRALFVRQTFPTPIPDGRPLPEGETELTFKFATRNASLPTPPNYRLTGMTFLDSNDQVVVPDTPVPVESCILGSAKVRLPENVHAVKYRIEHSTDWPDAASLTAAVGPAIAVRTGHSVTSFIAALNSVEATPVERYAIWYHFIRQSQLVYSDDATTARFLVNSNDRLLEALLGLRVATCDPFAFLAAGTASSFQVPCFTLGGLVPKKEERCFGAEYGHAQACLLANGTAYPLDLTVSAVPAAIQPTLVPWFTRTEIQSSVRFSSPSRTYELGEDLRQEYELIKGVSSKARGFSSIFSRSEHAVKKVLRIDTNRHAPSLAADGYTFISELPPIEHLTEKLAALRFAEYFTQLSRLIASGLSGGPATAALRVYQLQPIAPLLPEWAMEYLSPELLAIAKSDLGAGDVPQSMIVSYIKEAMGSKRVHPVARAAIAKWVIDDVTEGRTISVPLLGRPYRFGSLPIEAHLELFSQIAPSLEKRDAASYGMAVLGRVRLIQKERPHIGARERLSVDTLERFPKFMEVLDREFGQRKIGLSDSLRVEIAATAAWIGSELASRQEFKRAAAAVAVSLKGLSGRGRTSAKTLISALNAKSPDERKNIRSYLAEVGLTNSFDFMSDPELRQRVALLLGRHVVDAFLDLDGDSRRFKDWKTDLQKISKFGVQPDVSQDMGKLTRYIRKFTAREFEEGNTSYFFNYPSRENPASYLCFQGERTDLVWFGLMLKELQGAVTGYDERAAAFAWHRIDESKVANRIAKEAVLELVQGNVVLRTDSDDSTVGSSPVISDDPLFVPEFLKVNGVLGPGAARLLRMVNLPPKTDLLSQCLHRVIEEYPQVKEALLTGGSVRDLPEYSNHYALVEAALLNRLVDGVKRSSLYAAIIWCYELGCHSPPPWTGEDEMDTSVRLDWFVAKIRTSEELAPTSLGVAVTKMEREIALVLLSIPSESMPEWAEKVLRFSPAVFAGRNHEHSDVTDPLGGIWNSIYRYSKPAGDMERKARTVAAAIETVEREVNWIASRITHPHSQYLITRTGRLVVPAAAGEFTEFKPYAVGDDIRRIDWLASARTPIPVVRKMREHESRHLNLVYDVSVLASAYDSIRQGASLPAPIADLLMHLEIAHREGLKADITLMGRSVISRFSDLTLPREESPGIPFFKTEEFWRLLLSDVEASLNVLNMERKLFIGKPPPYTLFGHRTPEGTAGRLTYCVFSPRTMEPSSDYLNALAARGDIVDAVVEKPS